MVQRKWAKLIQIKEYGLERTLQLENKVALAFADIEYNGLEFDQELWLKNADDTETVVQTMENELDELVKKLNLNKFVKTSFQGDLFIPADEIRKIDIKWSSPTQVLKVFKEYGLDIEKVNAFELSKYKDRKFIAQYLKYKEKPKIVSTYGKSFLK